MNEPKSQTPLTDAEKWMCHDCGHSDRKGGPRDTEAVSADFARSLELKLQEVEQLRDEAKRDRDRWYQNFVDETRKAMGFKAERDQLIKANKILREEVTKQTVLRQVLERLRDEAKRRKAIFTAVEQLTEKDI